MVDPLEPGDDIYPSRTDKNIVYNDLIIPDLKDAIDLLPTRDEYGMEDLGRASKGSAAGMLAKVYLTLGKYDECLKMIQIKAKKTLLILILKKMITGMVLSTAIPILSAPCL